MPEMRTTEREAETNLIRLLREKNIGAAAVGAVMGVNQPQTVRRKLNKLYPFKLSEAKKIHKNLLSEYDFDYVFEGYDDVNEQGSGD